MSRPPTLLLPCITCSTTMRRSDATNSAATAAVKLRTRSIGKGSGACAPLKEGWMPVGVWRLEGTYRQLSTRPLTLPVFKIGKWGAL